MNVRDRGILKASGRAFVVVDEWMTNGAGTWVERIRFYDDGTVVEVLNHELVQLQRGMTDEEQKRYRPLSEEERARYARPMASGGFL